MLFNSYIFIFLFLPLTLALYYGFLHFEKEKMAKLVLVGMSLWFYGYFHVSYLLIIIISIVLNFTASKIFILLNEAKKAKKIVLILGIIGDVGLIFYFKYYDFFISNLNSWLGTSFVINNILMPLGISFFTFQQIAYLVDSYQGETKEVSLLDYALFVTFFPQLIAGPIVSYDEMIVQFQNVYKKQFDWDKLAKGIYLFAVGLGKKVLLADTLAKGVNWGFTNISELYGGEALVISLMFTFQLYFDFSGYCNMASGIANMFQMDLPINFNSPYKATSIDDFWKRWHITLTRFLRKYVYFPLGGSRKGKKRTLCNIMIVFLISGIWHGANWTYIMWGVLHGAAMALYRVFGKVWEKVPRIFGWLCTFLFVNFAFVIFRADSIKDCKTFFIRLFTDWGVGIHQTLYEQFMPIEFTYIEDHIASLQHMVQRIPGIHMWIILFITTLITFFTHNNVEKEYQPTVGSALKSIVLFTWSVLSLSGLSTFLYFNF